MPATVTHVVKPFQQDWIRQLEPDAIRQACQDIAYQERQHLLDPVVTMQLFFVQILHGHTACTALRHLTMWAVTASAYGRARMKLPLRVFQRLRRRSANADHTGRSMRDAGSAIAPLGRWLQFFYAGYPRLT
jgi:hypothetical protein